MKNIKRYLMDNLQMTQAQLLKQTTFYYYINYILSIREYSEDRFLKFIDALLKNYYKKLNIAG